MFDAIKLTADDFIEATGEAYLNGSALALEVIGSAMNYLDEGIEKKEITRDDAWTILKNTIAKTYEKTMRQKREQEGS